MNFHFAEQNGEVVTCSGDTDYGPNLLVPEEFASVIDDYFVGDPSANFDNTGNESLSLFTWDWQYYSIENLLNSYSNYRT